MRRQLKGITGTNLNISNKYNDSGIRTEKTVNGVTTKYHLLGDKVTFESNGTDKIYYNSDWGRFINADGIIGQKGELLGHNLFMYCKNNPIIMSDSDGFRPTVGIGGRETPEELEASLACMSEVNWNRYVKKQETIAYIASTEKAIKSGLLDGKAEKSIASTIKPKKVWKFGTLGRGKYVDEFSASAKIGRKALGSLGTIGLTAWDVGSDFQKGEYYSAGVDVVSAAAGIGIGCLIGLGTTAAIAAGGPALLIGVLAFGVNVGAGVAMDKFSTNIKDKYYGR